MKLTFADIARCLNLPVSTLDRWIRQGRIPVHKNGDEWSFDVRLLKKWAAARNLPFTLPTDNPAAAGPDPESETLETAMRRGGLHTGIGGTDIEGVLAAAADCVPGFTDEEKAELSATLLERELLTSTGLGKGVAIPHPRTPLSAPLEKAMIVTCYPRTPLDFKAIDARPVFVLFLLLSTSVKTHLHLLSKLAFCIRDDEFVRFLKGVPPAEQFFSKISELEHRIDKSGVL